MTANNSRSGLSLFVSSVNGWAIFAIFFTKRRTPAMSDIIADICAWAGSLTSGCVCRSSEFALRNAINILSKKTIGQLVPKLFAKVKVVHPNISSKYKGLRPNFNSPEICTISKLQEIASIDGFSKIREEEGIMSFICLSGYIVYNQKQIKTVTILNILNIETVAVHIGTISDLNDPHLACLTKFEAYRLDKWHASVENQTEKTASTRAKMFQSKETYSNFTSMVGGCLALCKLRIRVQKRSLVPAGLNSDVKENFFCQQRTIFHGSNSNPTVHQYKYGINATILGQNAVSKRSNASFTKRKSILPFIIQQPGPLKRKCIRL
ncbi:hypothetical protein MAR_007748 [Mya arenaria]|uniref:Uncharacterized protein n=1 Tax=Mya arenaria TaxID=6604 RepID=A0ABY7DU04_MYAAR|nr:hypothetical protein MAR_007748 [Mya arenaria]